MPSATLTWQPSATAGVTYNVWRSTSPGGEDNPSTGTLLNPAPLTAPTFTDSTVVSGTTYYYVVRAVNSAGTASTDSNEVSATIIEVPAAPTQLKITIN